MQELKTEAFVPAVTIEEILVRLTTIIEKSVQENNKNAYFAWLYRSVTEEVAKRIANNGFEDNPRMKRLDIIFANRYLMAYEQYVRCDNCTQSWQLAFDASSKWWPTILQHLMLGMNAHIHLDLGIAAAETSPGAAIHDLKNDFWMINQILHDKIDEVQDRLAKCWPLMSWIDWLGGNKDEALARMGINLSRGRAWRIAKKMAEIPTDQKETLLIKIDSNAFKVGKMIASPNIFGMLFLGALRLTEKGEVANHVKILNELEIKY